MCVPLGDHDIFGYLQPNSTCQNGGTCVSPNSCLVSLDIHLIYISYICFSSVVYCPMEWHLL